MRAPLGRRLCGVTANRSSGAYRVFSVLDRGGPSPAAGQFYMLSAQEHWQQRGQRPFLPRAFSVANAESVEAGQRLDFLLEAVGPGTERLCELNVGEGVWANGPLGNGFSEPREITPNAAGAILVGGGIGVAPLALLRQRFIEGGVPVRVLLGFRDLAHCGGLDDLFACQEVGLASEDGHRGHRGYVTDLLARMLDGDDSASAVVYACGPPPMLQAVGQMCAAAGVSCELAMESPMACGFGACFGCAVAKPGGGYLRLCLEGPVLDGDSSVRLRPAPDAGDIRGASARREAASAEGGGDSAAQNVAPAVELCGIKLAHPVINASGTFDAIAAREVYGDQLLEEFPFSAFVSKTITPEARFGNAPQRIWETPAGMINSIGLPNKGLNGFLAEDLPRLAELGVPLVISVMAISRDQFSGLVGALEEREEVAAIELNVSCPNVHSGLIVGEQPGEMAALLETLRPLTVKPLVVKLTPNVADPVPIAIAAEEGGADAISMINTVKATAIDPFNQKPGLASGRGGLSGPAVRPIAVAQVGLVSAAVGLPVIGMGGIGSGADASEFLAAGASLVAVGTESFRDPLAGRRIAEELGFKTLTRSP